jgi:type IV secretory pathway TrbD component
LLFGVLLFGVLLFGVLLFGVLLFGVLLFGVLLFGVLLFVIDIYFGKDLSKVNPHQNCIIGNFSNGLYKGIKTKVYP